MFVDTHCHLSYIRERGEDLGGLIEKMAEKKFRFVLDIGTKPGDYAARVSLVESASPGGKIPPFIHFSCGLWPDGAVIADRKDSLAALEADIRAMLAGKPAYAALGECGLDRYWNGPAAARTAVARAAAPAVCAADVTARASDPAARESTATARAADADETGTTDIAGEEELFGMQLDLAKKYGLPVIVHSRDAFDATYECIKNGGWDSGVIHCFSYGREEARAFLDRGWHISFPGNITWAKKEADRERIASLVRYVPRDRILLETDAPYLTPSPHRGKTNTPLLIEHTYACAAAMIGIDEGALAELVFANSKDLFSAVSIP